MGKCWPISTVIEYLNPLKILKIVQIYSLNPVDIGAFFLSIHVSNCVLRSPLSARILTFPDKYIEVRGGLP